MLKRRAYDVTLKLRQSSTRRRLAARHFTVDAKRIREWSSRKEQLVKGTVHAKKKFPLRLRRTSVVRFNGYRFHTV